MVGVLGLFFYNFRGGFDEFGLMHRCSSVNEAFHEAIMMNLGKIGGERRSKQGANKEF